MCIVEIGQVWFIDNKFGVSVQVISSVSVANPLDLPKFAFQGLGDNDQKQDKYVEEIMDDLIDE